MTYQKTSAGMIRWLFLGFVAGFLATLIFHQLTLCVLWAVGFAPFKPFSMALTKPFGVPAVISLAFWGGLWGSVFVLITGRLLKHGVYWIVAFLFGAILPTAVALLIVLPLKGHPMGGGWRLPLLITAFLVNGAWGVGTGLALKVFTGPSALPRK